MRYQKLKCDFCNRDAHVYNPLIYNSIPSKWLSVGITLTENSYDHLLPTQVNQYSINIGFQQMPASQRESQPIMKTWTKNLEICEECSFDFYNKVKDKS